MAYDKLTPESLYERLFKFAVDCLKLVKKLPQSKYNQEYGSQLVRSSGSPGSNYIEAIEGASRKDFTHRLKICRKETKESIHWLRLIKIANDDVLEMHTEADRLISESLQLIKIFTSSILTSERNQQIKK